MIRGGRVTIGGAGLAAIAVVALLVSSGCGYGGIATAASHPNLTNGQKLFSGAGQCAGCHTLQAAGSQGTIGPDLDNAFAGSVAQGYDVSSIENLVLDQIRLGSGPIATYTNAEHGMKGLKSQTPMPANLVTGQDAIDVAYYVASSVTANKGKFIPQVNLASLTSGADIFKLGPCGGCHTLAAAGTHGQVGPPLDSYNGSLTYQIVYNQVVHGGGAMPAFKGTLTDAQIQAVAKYVCSSAKGGCKK